LINPELIKSKVVDSLSSQDYTYTAPVNGNYFFIEDVSITGETRVNGPFQLGIEFGEKTENEKINWGQIQKENRTNQTTRQGTLISGLKVTNGKAGSATTLNFKVSRTGIYRVTYEMLQTAGFDLAGVRLADIDLINNGKSVPIYTYGKSTFGRGSYIEFYGQALDTLYTDTNIYTLLTNATKPPRIPVVTKLPTNKTSFANSYSETLTVNKQKGYSYSAPGADPWFDTSLMVYTTPKIWNLPFTINGLANNTTPANFEVSVWGGTDWPQNPDHHLQVSINGVPMADLTFDGLTEQTLSLNLPAGLLMEGANSLQLTLPGDIGVKYEAQRLDQYSITYPRLFTAQEGQLTFTGAADGFKVTNLPSNEVVVYRLDPAGALTRLTSTVTEVAGGTYTASFLGDLKNSTYFVSTIDKLFAPGYEARRVQGVLNQPAEYLVISHPDFIPNLQPLVTARQAQFTVSVVDVMDLYTQYTNGVFDPEAIRQYIRYAAENLGTRYVLLVGGDTYDYRNYTKLNSISFIPSLYAATDKIVTFAPVDPLYTDFNGDSIPDLAIGRFPVRTTGELDLLILKTLAYAAKDYGQTAVFASDKFDQGVSFQQISNSIASKLPNDWLVENLALESLDVTTARTRLLAAMNRGTALVNFTGHSGAADWTISGLFNQADIAKLTNAGRPFVVVQWGCWNTYYVYPNYNFLVQSFLFTGDNGAAAVLGATSLSTVTSEQLLGEILAQKLAVPGMTLGQAVQDAKIKLSGTNPEMLDVLLGWSLMGDPALVLMP
jgi:hypothetical protein